MNFVTIVTAMSGHGGHTVARQIAENNNDYRWYDHPKNNPDHPDSFPELKIAQNHFKKRFQTGESFPQLFDRIESFLLDLDAYYNLIEEEIFNISQGKRLIYVCHETPKNIRKRYPDADIIQILPRESCIEDVIDRHMKTHMKYPLQKNIHNLPGRKPLLNKEYWNQQSWIENNKPNDCLINYRMDKFCISASEVIKLEIENQKKLYIQHMLDSKYADKSIVIENVSTLNI